MSACLIVPTRNPGPIWTEWLSAFKQQRQFVPGVVVDSASTDGIDASCIPLDWRLLSIRVEDFSHGGTRNMALQYLPSGTKVVIFMTQDALLGDPDALQSLLSAFNDPSVGCAYGRQLPHVGATPIAAHARIFNYSDTSHTISIADQPQLGIKACFLSNSFAAYRLSDLLAVGGFPSDVILGEDMAVAARLLMAGKQVAYVANAFVYHSHNYSHMQEFQRYFDTGVFHARSPWLLNTFGGAGGEGMRFVYSELNYLWQLAPTLIPSAAVRTLAKWLGYMLGRCESKLPLFIKRRCSMHKGYWS